MSEDTRFAAQQILQIIPPVMRIVAAELRRTGHLPTPAHFGVLLMLHDGTYSLGQLANSQGVSLPTMSSTVSRMEERGWLERVRAKNDRRIVMVHLTPAGREKLIQISRKAEERLLSLLVDLTQHEQATLVAGLTILKKVFDVADQSIED